MPAKTMPNDIFAEQSVIGSMFLSKYAATKVLESLTSDSFYIDSHKIIYQVVSDLSNKGTPIDITTVSSELKNRNKLQEVGGIEYLTEILDMVPSAANIDYYVKIVQDNSLRRNLINVSTSIVELGYDGEDINDALDEAEKRILTISKNKRTTEFKNIKDVLYKTQTDLETLSKNKGDITGLATGWYDIDKLTSGLQASQLIIIAARPAMGKTAFALNLASHVAMTSDKAVALFNLEMSAEQLATRMISSLGQIEGYKLKTGYLMNEDWKRVNEAISQLSNSKLYIDDTPGITIGELRSKCRRLASSDEGLSLVVIDYLQLLSGNGKYGNNRQQEVSDISRALKTMAMELKVPVIALSQLSRSVEGREDKRPLMSDLRESGSIEQDADIVAMLYRDDYYNKEARNDTNTSLSEFIIGKHRNGPTATIELLFKRDTSTFLSYRKEEGKE